jgi:hypothetical protein
VYTTVISIWIADWHAYEKAMAVRAKELIDEVPLFTKVMPIIQTDEVFYLSAGHPRTAARSGRAGHRGVQGHADRVPALRSAQGPELELRERT